MPTAADATDLPPDALGLAGAPFHLDDDALAWVGTTLAGLSPEQKVGQLFCLIDLPATTENIDAHLAVAEPGGYMRRPAPSAEIAALNAYIQSRVRVPALIAANIESGADMIGTDLTSFGSPLQTAATGDATNAYRLGLVCGTEARAVGCTWGFAPVVDVQLNHANPMVLTRGFGSDAATVATFGAAFVRGLQEAGVAASVKHWPGDGVDDRDQHLVTAVNTLSVEEWEATFGHVYRTVIDAGAMTVMAAHIALPAWSRALRPGIADEDILPASLAPEITTELLREGLGFRGLVVTDASLMAGMQLAMPRRDLVPAAIAAGCDMFLFTQDYAEDHGFLLDGVRRGVVSEARLDEAVTRVLALKAAVGLHRAASVQDLVPDPTCAGVDRVRHLGWARGSADAAITLVKDKDPRSLPMDPARHRRVLVYSLRGPDATTAPVERFVEAMSAEGFELHVMGEWATAGPGERGFGRMGAVTGRELLESFDAVVYLLDVWPVSNQPTPRLYWSIMGANAPKFTIEVPTVVVSLGSPFHLQDMPRVKTFVNAYGRNDATVLAVVEKLLGRSPFTGRSPVDPFCGYWDAHL